MMKKICSKLLVVVLCVMSCIPVYAAEQGKEVTTENDMARINPIYPWYQPFQFTVGSDTVAIDYWGDEGKGGVTLTSRGYCDYNIKGAIYDSWNMDHPFDTRRDQTTYCEATAYCETINQIISVYAYSEVSSDDGSNVFDKQAYWKY